MTKQNINVRNAIFYNKAIQTTLLTLNTQNSFRHTNANTSYILTVPLELTCRSFVNTVKGAPICLLPCEVRVHILYTVIEMPYSDNSYLSSPINKCISMSEVKRHGQSILPVHEHDICQRFITLKCNIIG